MSSSRKFLLIALAHMLVLAMSMPAMITEVNAQGARARREASQFFERGEKFLAKCDYDKAIKNFKAAYRIAPHYVIYYYLGLAHYRKGSKGEALHYFRKYMYVMEQEGVHGQDAQLAFVRQAIDDLGKEVRAKAVRERERMRFEKLYKSVVGLLDTLVNREGEAVAAPYLQRYMEVTARDIADATRANRRETILALESLEAHIRAELARSSTTGSRFLRGTGIVLTTAGLICLGMGVKAGIDAAGTAEPNVAQNDNKAVHAIGLSGAGIFAAVLGFSLYRYGKTKRKNALLYGGISISPKGLSTRNIVFVRGYF